MEVELDRWSWSRSRSNGTYTIIHDSSGILGGGLGVVGIACAVYEGKLVAMGGIGYSCCELPALVVARNAACDA